MVFTLKPASAASETVNNEATLLLRSKVESGDIITVRNISSKLDDKSLRIDGALKPTIAAVTTSKDAITKITTSRVNSDKSVSHEACKLRIMRSL